MPEITVPLQSVEPVVVAVKPLPGDRMMPVSTIMLAMSGMSLSTRSGRRKSCLPKALSGMVV